MAEKNIHRNHFSNILLKIMLKNRAPDVSFTFEEEGQSVEIPAHRELLATGSKVFDKMFNSELKEKGTVKIVDASAAAFREFLQFFYEDQVKLKMDNIEDLLNLAHKYDVPECLTVVIQFLKENLQTDLMVWGLEISIKYQSDDLKAFCKMNIAQDLVTVLNQIECADSNAETLSTKSELLSKMSLASIAEILSIAKQVITDQSEKIVSLQPKFGIASIACCLTNILQLFETELFLGCFQFKWDRPMHLTEIHLASVFDGSILNDIDVDREVSIMEASGCIIGAYLGRKDFKQISLFIKKDTVYTIDVKVLGNFERIVVFGFQPNRTNGMTVLNKPKYALIDRLVFKEVPNS